MSGIGNLQWNDPIQTERGWIRECLIPIEKRGNFFEYWKLHSSGLKEDGFGVYKKDKDWFVTQYKTNVEDFNLNKKIKPAPIVKKEPVKELPLVLEDVKYKDGLREWQIGSVSKLRAAIKRYGAAVDGSQMGCHAKGQKILMADGTTKNVEDILVNDKVMGWCGAQTVTDLHRGRQQMAKIIPIKGDPFTVNINHILTLVLSGASSYTNRKYGYSGGNIIDIKVSDFLKLNSIRNAFKLFRVPINTWPERNQPLAPYFLGCLLGDGGLSHSAITFTSVDEIMWDEIKTQCKINNWILGSTNEEIAKRITFAPYLFNTMRNLNLFPISCENRFIPDIYKFCNREQRLQILAGLLDTDGYSTSGGYEFTSKSKRLAEDVQFIAKSLGLAAYLKKVNKQCVNNGVWGVYYRLYISGDCSVIPCKSLRKKSTVRKQKKNVLRTGFTIELLPEDDFFGFSLDGDGRFLLGDFTVTHNTGKTYSACGLARELNIPFVIVCPKAVKGVWKTVALEHFKLNKNFIGVINYELLSRGRKDSDICSLVKDRSTGRNKIKWKLPKDTLIIYDEAHKLKNYDTKNSKFCMDAYKNGYKLLFLSATVIINPIELRTIGTCLKLFKTAGEYYKWITDNGCTKGIWSWEFNNDKDVLLNLNRILFDERGIRLRKDLIPNFPETEISVQGYDLDDEKTSKINAVYKNMHNEIKKLNKLKDTSENELTIRLRSRQIVELLKTDIFIELAEEGIDSGMSVIIFLNYSESIDILSKAFKTTCIYDGRLKDSVRDENLRRFQDNIEPIILINIKAGNAGINCPDLDGKHPRLCLISPDDSAVYIQQCTGRAVRENSKSSTLQKIVLANNTIETKVMDNLSQKLTNLDTINDGDLKI